MLAFPGGFFADDEEFFLSYFCFVFYLFVNLFTYQMLALNPEVFEQGFDENINDCGLNNKIRTWL